MQSHGHWSAQEHKLNLKTPYQACGDRKNINSTFIMLQHSNSIQYSNYKICHIKEASPLCGGQGQSQVKKLLKWTLNKRYYTRISKEIMLLC